MEEIDVQALCTTTAKQQLFMTDQVMKRSKRLCRPKYGQILHASIVRASINVARAVCPNKPGGIVVFLVRGNSELLIQGRDSSYEDNDHQPLTRLWY